MSEVASTVSRSAADSAARPAICAWFCALTFAAAAACGNSSSPDAAALDAAASDGPDAAAQGDSSPTGDAGDAAPAEAPILAAPDTWSFVDFPDARCAYGTATGIGINPHADSDSLVIFLEGGGACSTVADCYDKPAALHLAGYDSTTFGSGPRSPVVLTRDAQNPLASANLVFVPYCTGDHHSGAVTASFSVKGVATPTYFWGGRDMDLFLARLAPTFAHANHVWLIGTSAGGFGTLFNFDRVRLAFPGARVDVLDDSGPAIDPTPSSADAVGVGVWGTPLPAGCCSTMQQLYDHDRAQQPNSRFGFLSFEYDSVIGPRFGYTTGGYPAALDPFASHVRAGANAATFIVQNSPDAGAHVVESVLALDAYDVPWIRQMVDDDPAWTSKSVVP